jgi:mRNA interferase RelE/StbE
MSKPYVIGFKKAALDSLKGIDRSAAENILKKLLQLARNADNVQHNALTGQWKGYYKLRMGDYRIIYQLEYDERLIIVLALGHRREVYDE